MGRWIKRLFGVLIVAGLVAALVYAFLPQPVPVDTAEVVRGPLRVTIDEDGKTRIKERYIVSAPLAGRLQRITLDPGDPVAAGETRLAVIEPQDPALLDARTVAQAEAQVKAAEATLQKVTPALVVARELLQFAESEANRGRGLFVAKTLSRQELDQLELDQRTKAEDYKSLRFQEDIARFELQQAQAALLRSRPMIQSDAEEWNFEIKAPVTGSVLKVFQESGGLVAGGTALVELGDPRDLEAEVDVLSSDGVRIPAGARVLLEEWGGDRPLEGRVRLVEPAAFTKISALGVEEQRVNVIIDLVEPAAARPTLGDAFRVEARIIVWEEPDVVKVPNGALFRQGSDWAVYVVENEHARLQTVQLGQRNSTEAQVTQGLEPGTRLIVHPSDKVRDGSPVALRQ